MNENLFYNCSKISRKIMNEKKLEELYEYIDSAGYKYASELYGDGFVEIFANATPTQEDVYNHFDECAQHEGIQVSLFENKESEHFKYLDLLDHDDIVDHFYMGGYRLIDEKFGDA
jgi:hypothetical protein